MKKLFFILFFVFSALLLSIGLQAKTKQAKPKIYVAKVAKRSIKIVKLRVRFVIINSKVRQTNQAIYNLSEVKNKGKNKQPVMSFISFLGTSFTDNKNYQKQT